MFNKRLTALLCTTVMVGSLAVGCGAKDNSSKITISGSTSVGPTMEILAEAYEKNNDVKIEIQQVGSSAGIKNTIDGTSDLGMSSRDLKDEEAQAVDATEIALDGIAVVTNKDNPVSDLTLEQVKDIFTGKITNWKEVGGEDAQIVLVSREEGSGTRDGFQDILGFESADLVKDAQICDGSGAVKSTIEGVGRIASCASCAFLFRLSPAGLPQNFSPYCSLMYCSAASSASREIRVESVLR